MSTCAREESLQRKHEELDELENTASEGASQDHVLHT